MATWVNRPNSRDVLDAAGRWKQQCLIDDRSLFSPERLWSPANADTLCEAFLENPILGSEKFIDKLERQLSNSPATIQKLAAECLWLLHLFVADNQMGAAAKRERITRIWSLSGSTAPESRLVKKLNRPQGGRCTLAGTAGSGANFGCLMQRDVRRPVAVLELLAGAAWAWIVAARIRRLVELP